MAHYRLRVPFSDRVADDLVELSPRRTVAHLGTTWAGLGQFGLAASWRTLHQQWLAHARRQIHHLQRHWIDDVPCRTQLGGEFAWRREHVGFLSSRKLHRKRHFCICWFVDFSVIQQPYRLVRFHVGCAGSRRRLCFFGSKAMILLIRRPVPAELRL